MKAYPECNGDRVKTYPDCNDDGVVDKDTDDERQCPTFGGVGFVPDDDDYEEVIKTSRVALSVTKHQKQTMKSILGVSLLILLMPSAYAVALPATAPTGSACMTPTAWDATTLASTPASTDSFSLWMR